MEWSRFLDQVVDVLVVRGGKYGVDEVADLLRSNEQVRG